LNDVPPRANDPTPPRRADVAALAISTAALVVAGLALTSGGEAAAPNGAAGTAPAASAARPAPETPAPEAGDASLSDAFRRVARDLRPAVVSITTERFTRLREDPIVQAFGRLFGRDPGEQGRVERSFGTGFLVRPDGLALTNNHVVAGAKQVHVLLDDGSEVEARVIGTDPLSDLAVLALAPRPDGAPYAAVELGDSKGLEVGDWVMAVGNPFGLEQTVTAGIVSAKGRSRMGVAAYEDFIQTDVAINPGNSGGPLVALDGRVVGVTTAIVSETGEFSGVGFAIPIGMAKDVMDDIVRRGRVVRGWLGVSVQDASPALAERLGLGPRRGVLVTAVLPGGPAETAGLATGDLIVGFAGEGDLDSTKLQTLAADAPVGEPTRLVVVRGGEEHRVDVVLGERPAEGGDADEAAEAPRPSGVGLRARELTPQLVAYFGYEPGAEGVVIVDVEPGSLAAEEGVRPGLILQEVDGRPIHDLEDLNAAVDALDPAAGVLLRVWDGAASTFFLIPPFE